MTPATVDDDHRTFLQDFIERVEAESDEAGLILSESENLSGIVSKNGSKRH